MNRLQQRRFVWFGVGLVILFGLLFYANSANKGRIVTADARPRTVTPANKTYTGKYMSFVYPGTYRTEARPAQGVDLEVAMLSADTNYDKRLAVSVSDLPGGLLDNNSAYKLRSTYTNLYASRALNTPGGAATVWVKRDNSEQTAFIQKGNRVAVLSFTTANTSEDLTAEVNALLGSFKWSQG